MALAERLIEQTFAKAEVEITDTHSGLITGALKVADGEQLRAIALVDNGLAGKKLVALTTRALFVIGNTGAIAAQLSIREISDLEISWGALTIRYELPAGGSMEHIYNLADSAGAYELRREFEALRGSS